MVSDLISLRGRSPVYILSLGCSKNLVDAEFLAGALAEAGYPLTSDPSTACIIIVNTCGFIESAKEEAIAAVLEMADYKEARCRILAVTGCLAERYSGEIAENLPEADLIIGAKSYYEIPKALDAALLEISAVKIYKSTAERDAVRHLKGKRKPSTAVYAYLKIAEGCFHRCSYCAIPLIRGRHISRPMEDLIAETEDLVRQGYREIIMVAQDLSAYGTDLYGERRLNTLIAALLDIPGLLRLRTLYLYCEAINPEFMELMATRPNFMPYVDLPIQHASDRILKRMRRRETQERLRTVFRQLRAAVPGLALRTTVMTGFPGETEADFEELLSFIEEIRFDHLGCFIFSPEEGTAAAEFSERVDPQTAESRYRRIMELQRRISAQVQAEQLGRSVKVLLECASEDGLYYIGRMETQAPEVDGHVRVLAPNYPLEKAQLISAEILEADSYDFIARETAVLE